MKFNRSHLQVIIMQLEKHDWTFTNKNRFSSFFDRCASIFDPDTRKEMNSIIEEFQTKWGYRILTCESLMFHSFQSWRGEPIRKKQYYEKIIGGKRQKTWKYVNVDPEGMEMDLRRIRLWCHLQTIRICREHELNFEELIKIEQK